MNVKSQIGNDMTSWIYYPRNRKCPEHLVDIVDVFKSCENEISSTSDNSKGRVSNEVLGYVSPGLRDLGYQVEVEGPGGKKKKIKRPVLFGKDGSISVYYEVDAYNDETKTLIEVEAGRATDNNQWLKDLMEAFLIYDARYLVIAVKLKYTKTNKIKEDFKEVCDFMEAIYSSDRIKVPLEGILIIGY